MIENYPALIVTVPLIFSLLVYCAGWLNKNLCHYLALIALAISAYSSSGLLLEVLQKGLVHYRLGGWPAPWGIVYDIDHLNGMVLVVVSAVALVNMIAAKKSIEKELPDKIGPFYSLYLLQVTGLLGMVATGDAFNLYVLLEIASLTGYALVAMGEKRAPLAALNYVFLGTIGACFYLLGVGYLYIMTGSLNMVDISTLLIPLHYSKAIWAAFIFCLVGCWIKMAFFPLHAWLPNAYTYAPSAASSLLAPLTTKVMVYVMIRLMITVFTPKFTFSVMGASDYIVWMAVLAIIISSFLALSERNIKKMLTYIIIAEVGYMVGATWLGNRTGMTGAILHIMNDALMMLCLFMAVGNIAYKQKNVALEDMKGIFQKMPITMAAFTLGALSIIGIPPTVGFFSKWYMILGAFQSGHYSFVVALLFSSLVCVILFFRVFEIGFFESSKSSHNCGHADERMEEAPVIMMIPLVIVSVSIILVGVYTGEIVSVIINNAIPLSLP